MKVCFDIEENELGLLREAVTFAMKHDKEEYENLDRNSDNWKLIAGYYTYRWLALYKLEFALLEAIGGLEKNNREGLS